MKKIIFILLLIAAGFLVWKYFHNPKRQPTLPEQAVGAASNFIPDEINRKNTMEKNINDSVNKENERLQKSLDQIK